MGRMEQNKPAGWDEEALNLDRFIAIIQNNIEEYTRQFAEASEEAKELYDNYRSNNPELHNDLVIGLDWKSQLARILSKNKLAVNKPYFGRIDLKEVGEEHSSSLYLGKHGIRKSPSQGLIVDWRAPISSVYYESEIGESSYKTPFGEEITISLDLKRTYEIEEGKLIDYYDSNVITNDEFLTKYLSKNKEVVLGEIIATIQKEQNDIIRDTPWHNVVVQGVAGSGKTTVAMHRISYILYNYKDKFRPDEFYIIGSNKMLLNYITGVLPNLDVYNVNQMTMLEFLLLLLDKDFNLEKSKYQLNDPFMRLQREDIIVDEETEKAEEIHRKRDLKRWKGSLEFIKGLERYLKVYERSVLLQEDAVYHGRAIYSKKEMEYFIDFFGDKSMQEKMDLMNKRVTYLVKSWNEEHDNNKEVTNAEVKKYNNYFGNCSKKINLMEIYQLYLSDMIENPCRYTIDEISVPSKEVVELLIQDLHNKQLDLYDLSMLVMIKRKLKKTKDFEYVSHIVIDEAQDFGVMIFYLMKKIFVTCTYTIMGDVSQNIYYDTGMNDWEALTQEVFLAEKDQFYLLSKSYRNTVEISNYAAQVLKKCSFKTYEIEPIIRHGKAVELRKVKEHMMVKEVVKAVGEIQKNGYNTIAIICRTMEETQQVYALLEQHIRVEQMEENMENMSFANGVMILPIHLTKGLEFDGVILWNPVEQCYREGNEDAKLLYVAITRALHELYVIYHGELTKLLE